MKENKLNTGDLVVLKTNWIIIYKLIRKTRDGLRAMCIDFTGTQRDFYISDLEKYRLVTISKR